MWWFHFIQTTVLCGKTDVWVKYAKAIAMTATCSSTSNPSQIPGKIQPQTSVMKTIKVLGDPVGAPQDSSGTRRPQKCTLPKIKPIISQVWTLIAQPSLSVPPGCMFGALPGSHVEKAIIKQLRTSQGASLAPHISSARRDNREPSQWYLDVCLSLNKMTNNA